MNGPVILNNARELLAHEIFRYREPKPSPLQISPWLAMSLLQKAIRRGEIELAQRSAATLLLIAPERLVASIVTTVARPIALSGSTWKPPDRRSCRGRSSSSIGLKRK
jgi:hypothetical protein